MLANRVHTYPHSTTCQLEECSLLQPPPSLLWRDVVIQAEEVEEITRTPPGIAVPMRVTSPEHLKAWTHITPMMMLLERTRPNPTTIQHHIATDHHQDILRAAPFPY